MDILVKNLMRSIFAVILTISANFFLVGTYFKLDIFTYAIPIFALFFLFVPLFGASKKYKDERMVDLVKGSERLILFLISETLTLMIYGIGKLNVIDLNIGDADPNFLWNINLLASLGIISLFFLTGMIGIMRNSSQIDIKIKLLAFLLGLIPIINLVLLGYVIYKSSKELYIEDEKKSINTERKSYKLCQTKYPILFVDGMFFKEIKPTGYWGRIPKELINNGARIFYANNNPCTIIKESGIQIAERIQQIVKDSGCGKVNIIAFSKAGLDVRYTLDLPGMDQYIASITTINTPHQGCIFADYIFNVASQNERNHIAKQIDNALRKHGVTYHNFLQALGELTTFSCGKFNSEHQNTHNVYCQSVMSKAKNIDMQPFPLYYYSKISRYLGDSNDGLTMEHSAKWGVNNFVVESQGNIGISCADMIDFREADINGFDVREFYVQIIQDLKERGY